MLDIKGADASKVILVVGIMTLHSFGEGSGVGVSFAGSKGLSQGLLITIAIAVHNIPEGLAVSMLLSSRGVSPQKAMLWSIITSLPQVRLSFFLSSSGNMKLVFYECIVLILQSNQNHPYQFLRYSCSSLEL
jgi:zinc transporter ZupT